MYLICVPNDAGRFLGNFQLPGEKERLRNWGFVIFLKGGGLAVVLLVGGLQPDKDGWDCCYRMEQWLRLAGGDFFESRKGTVCKARYAHTTAVTAHDRRTVPWYAHDVCEGAKCNPYMKALLPSLHTEEVHSCVRSQRLGSSDIS